MRGLLSLIETNPQQMHKMNLTSVYPARIPTSSVLLSFLYLMQTPQVDQQSFEMLIDTLRLRFFDSLSGCMQQNNLLFFTVLTLNANHDFLAYVYD